MKTSKLFINGEWINSERSFHQINPNTSETFGEVGEATENEVDQAVNAAYNALPIWSNKTVAERASIVKNAADILANMYGNPGEPTELKLLISNEMGKRLPEADIEVIESSDMMAYYANNGERLLTPKELSLNTELWPTKKSTVEYTSVGVIGIIKPWNYPLELPIWSLAPALVAGNTIVFKPSEHSSFIGLEIGKIFEEAGIPKGVLNVITGGGETGNYLVNHPRVNMIDFTGSVAVGKIIASNCAKSLKKYNLELGGNDAAIVCKDADMELTANGLVWGAFCNSGQVCVSVKRAFIDNQVCDKLIDKLIDKTTSLVAENDYGPIISAQQLSEIESFVADAVSKGAKIVTGGKRIEGKKGFYYLPTILTNITTDMNIMQNECFGPILPIMPVATTEEAISLANNSAYGLGASIWTSNKEAGIKIARRIQSGMVWVNDVNVAFPEAPWGGIKNSGIGISLSDNAIYEYINYKHISIEESDDERRVWWYPYQ